MITPQICSLLLTLLLALPIMADAQTIELITPIAGLQGEDFFVVNHVDHDSSAGIRDYACGTKTYDGHQGTDFTLRSFAQMDSGVAILAAADGLVTRVVDSLFDRNKVSVVERGFGNWIEVSHGDGWYTYYAHLRTGSAVVEPGDSVRAGEAIAQVGSSGNSSDPHLHFEVWRVTSILHDPFGEGTCSEGRPSLWKDQPVYRTSYEIIDAGLLDWVPTLDTLRERPATSESFAPPDTAISFWIHQEGIREGDRLKVIWERSVDDRLWFEFETEAFDRDWWYHYFWTWIDLPPADGYRVRYLVNGEEVLRIPFSVGEVTGVRDERLPVHDNFLSVRHLANELNLVAIEAHSYDQPMQFSASLYTLTGEHLIDLVTNHTLTQRHLFDLTDLDYPKGAYLLRVEYGENVVGVVVGVK